MTAPVPLRPLAEHRAAVVAALTAVPVIDLPIADAAGTTLAQDIVANEPVPATDVAAVDGYAVSSADAVGGVTLPVAFDVGPGESLPRVHVRGTAVRISSGSPLPRGADAVVPLAQTDGGVGAVRLDLATRPGESVRPLGYDVALGQALVTAGARLGARELGAAAALGLRRVRVRPVPRVVVIAVGSELGSDARSIPDANSPMLTALVDDAGARAYRVGHVADDPAALAAALEDQVVRADVILTTGGLSCSRHDTLAEVLRAIGTVDAAPVALSGCGVHAIGRIGGEEGVPVVALPGHPVEALVAFESYVRQALRAMSGFHEVNRVTIRAEAARPWASRRGVMQAVPVTLDLDDEGVVSATPLGAPPAGPSLSDLVASDGIAWVPADTTHVLAGDTVRCTVWDR